MSRPTGPAPSAAVERPDLSGLTVLVAHHSWPLETFLAELFDRVSAFGADVHLQARPHARPPFQGAAPAASPFDRPLAVARTVARRARSRGGAGREVRARETAADARRVGADVVYFPWIRAAAGLATLGSGPPQLVSCRGTQVNLAPWLPGGEELREDLRVIFREAAVVHCVSSAIEREAVALGLDPADSVVVRPGVDPDRFLPPAAPRRHPGPLRLVAVGALRWVKGFDTALLALAEARRDGVEATLDIIGEGPDRRACAGMIREFGLTGSARLVGRLPPAEVASRMRSADAYVLSSVAEGISNAALEAMATELPLVTTDCGGMREVVDDGVEGEVVPVRDHRAMARAFARLAEDPDRRLEMGRAGRRRIIEGGHTSEVTARRFGALLARAAGA